MDKSFNIFLEIYKLFKKIIIFLLIEPFLWLEDFINFLPGRFGRLARFIWYFFRFKKIDFFINIDRNCDFKGSKNISFDKSVGISKNCYFNAIEGEIKVGEKTAFNVGCHINSSIGGKILIGKRCPIGPNVVMRTTNHNFIDKKNRISAGFFCNHSCNQF